MFRLGRLSAGAARSTTCTTTAGSRISAIRRFNSVSRQFAPVLTRSSAQIHTSATPRQAIHSSIQIPSARSFSTTTVTMGVHNVTSKKEFDTTIAENQIVVLDAFATWCGPCKVVAPKVVALSEKYPDAHFIKIDVDDVPDVAQELGIRAMPTFCVFKDGKKVPNDVVGADPKSLETLIQAHYVEGATKASKATPATGTASEKTSPEL